VGSVVLSPESGSFALAASLSRLWGTLGGWWTFGDQLPPREPTLRQGVLSRWPAHRGPLSRFLERCLLQLGEIGAGEVDAGVVEGASDRGSCRWTAATMGLPALAE
jgi:hypothetical protein